MCNTTYSKWDPIFEKKKLKFIKYLIFIYPFSGTYRGTVGAWAKRGKKC